jgi:hypothetical protein
MSRLSTAFRNDTEINHHEHEFLMQQLAALDSALDELVCYAEVFADLGSAARVCRCGRELALALPRHFAHEEAAILEPVSKLNSELAVFTEEMKRQHRVFQAQFEALRQVMDGLEDAPDLEAAICALKEKGQEFTHGLASHMGAEERRLNRLLYVAPPAFGG